MGVIRFRVLSEQHPLGDVRQGAFEACVTKGLLDPLGGFRKSPSLWISPSAQLDSIGLRRTASLAGTADAYPPESAFGRFVSCFNFFHFGLCGARLKKAECFHPILVHACSNQS